MSNTMSSPSTAYQSLIARLVLAKTEASQEIDATLNELNLFTSTRHGAHLRTKLNTALDRMYTRFICDVADFVSGSTPSTSGQDSFHATPSSSLKIDIEALEKLSQGISESSAPGSQDQILFQNSEVEYYITDRDEDATREVVLSQSKAQIEERLEEDDGSESSTSSLILDVPDVDHSLPDDGSESSTSSGSPKNKAIKLRSLPSSQD